MTDCETWIAKHIEHNIAENSAAITECETQMAEHIVIDDATRNTIRSDWKQLSKSKV